MTVVNSRLMVKNIAIIDINTFSNTFCLRSTQHCQSYATNHEQKCQNDQKCKKNNFVHQTN